MVGATPPPRWILNYADFKRKKEKTSAEMSAAQRKTSKSLPGKIYIQGVTTAAGLEQAKMAPSAAFLHSHSLGPIFSRRFNPSIDPKYL